jgi:hypothetical protein
MADYEANFDELIELGKDDSEIIYSETTQREQQLKSKDFKITVGSSLDVKIRNVQYSDYRVYQEDEGLRMLKKTPSHFKPGDLSVREFIGILYCMIKYYNQNRLTNCTLGGDSIRKVDQLNCDEAGNYYHLTIPGIPTYDVNIIKSSLLNLSNWKAKGFNNLEKLQPHTIDLIALKYSDIKRIYNERKVAKYDEYPPVFDKFGNLDIQQTFEYGKLFSYMGWQLKANTMEKYKCVCNNSFVTKGKFERHHLASHQLLARFQTDHTNFFKSPNDLNFLWFRLLRCCNDWLLHGLFRLRYESCNLLVDNLHLLGSIWMLHNDSFCDSFHCWR